MNILNLLLDIEQSWHDSKSFIEHIIGFSHDALHVLIGPPIQLAIAATIRTNLRDLRPLAILLVLELLNEWHDLRVEQWPDAGMQWGEGAKDLVLTLALPVLLMLVARYAPSLFGVEKREG